VGGALPFPLLYIFRIPNRTKLASMKMKSVTVDVAFTWRVLHRLGGLTSFCEVENFGLQEDAGEAIETACVMPDSNLPAHT